MLNHKYSGVESILNYDQKTYKNLSHQAQLKFNDQIFALDGEPDTLKMQFTLTPSLITQEQFNEYKKCCDQFNAIIEKIGDYILAENQLLIEFFPKYQPYVPYTKIKKYLHNLYCRYDFFIDESNQIKFCETNSHGGGGFFMFSLLSQIIYEYLQLEKIAHPQPYHEEFYFCEGITQLAQHNQMKSGAIAILYDNNSPIFNRSTISFFELTVLAKQLSAYNRKVFLVDIKDLTLNQNNELCYDGHVISVSFNKMTFYGRDVSKDKRYAAYLQAVKQGSVFPINSVAGMTFLQDKSLFAFLTGENYHHLFTNEEVDFIHKHIPGTSRLTTEDPNIEKFIKNKNDYVIKPANLARGKGVYVGSTTSQTDWNDLIKTYSDEDYIIQQKVTTQPVDIFHIIDDQLKVDKMNQVYSAYYLGGELTGFIDRVSIESVTNISGTAYGHPVFVLK